MHWVLSDDSTVDVLNVIDDHSRLCVASKVYRTVRSPDVVRTLHVAADTWGYPAGMLTDNGAIFTSFARGGESAMEAELLSLGITTRHSRPYHPQTCGKVERFHQTLKQYLAKQDLPATKKQLQGQLNRFVRYYNEVRLRTAVLVDARPTKYGTPGGGPHRADRRSTLLAVACCDRKSIALVASPSDDEPSCITSESATVMPTPESWCSSLA